jgi:hypothetical protein
VSVQPSCGVNAIELHKIMLIVPSSQLILGWYTE